MTAAFIAPGGYLNSRPHLFLERFLAVMAFSRAPEGTGAAPQVVLGALEAMCAFHCSPWQSCPCF